MSSPGTDPASAYSRHVNARFRDFTNPRTPWSRRLWDVGTFLTLEELHEVGQWLDRQVLSPSAVNWLQRSLEARLGQDAAFGSKELRQQLTQCLRSDLTVRSDGRRRLRHVIDVARPGYLDRWAAQVALDEPPGAERAARATAAHLLDSGHSLVGLRRWLGEHSQCSAVDLLVQAAELADKGPRMFSIWVRVNDLPEIVRLADPLPHFTRHASLPGPIADKLRSLDSIPALGAFNYTVEARDAERAVELVSEVIERMRARARFAHSNRHIVFSSEVYVETEDRFIELRVPDRNAAIMSLMTEGQLLDVIPAKTYAAERHAIDDALELAAPLNSGGLAPAISGAWAALEALLTDSQDSDKKEGKVGAATHAARLVACSWPRAELTALSYRIDPERGTGRELSARLDVAETNRDRSQIIADQLRNTGQIPLLRTWRLPSDAAAVTRMNRLLANPTGMLTQVSDYVEGSLRRMYRCRNVIVHGGSTRGDVLDSTLRVVAPLVGATLDRITHAHIVLGIEPLELATRADAAVALASDHSMGPHIVDLLGRR